MHNQILSSGTIAKTSDHVLDDPVALTMAFLFTTACSMLVAFFVTQTLGLAVEPLPIAAVVAGALI